MRWQDEHATDFFSATTGIGNKEKAGLEGVRTGTGQIIENGVYVREKLPMPMHMIFDEAARLNGPIFSGSFSTQVEGFVCSPDNSVELENGWFVKADSISELASLIGQDPDPLYGRVPLEETVARWNDLCAAGEDTDHSRAKNLVPIQGPPFYALEFFGRCLNTQGGMTRNVKAQVIDIYGEPIPRLYSAGRMAMSGQSSTSACQT